jgi:plastocyanin
MKTEFRNRAFLPIVMPLGVLLGIVALVVSFALILLYNTHEAALVIAVVAAAGILTAISLAASKDELSGAQKAAVVLAGALPVAVGVVFSLLSVNGAVDASELNINREPPLAVPEDAVIAADNSNEFCLPQEDGSCQATRDWQVGAQEDSFLFEFLNNEAGTPHNVAIFTLSDDSVTGDSVEPGMGEEELFTGDVFPGVDSRVYDVEEGLEQGVYFFQCSVHPTTMIGVMTVAEGGEAAEG